MSPALVHGAALPDPHRGRRLLWLAAALLALNSVALACLLGLGLAAGASALGLGVVAWLLGARHAFDADHIAAIDNVTRRLRQSGHRPVGVGFFFSLGHSTVVIAATLAVILVSQHARGAGAWLSSWGVPLSLLASAAFLTLIGLLNLRSLLRPATARAAGAFQRIGHSRAMFPVGLVCGLNLDTAGEILLLVASAAALSAASLPWCALLSFPILFTAGMALADTGEGLLMVRVYDWALLDGDRTLRLNTVITSLSVLLALGVAAVQWAGLARWAGVAVNVPEALAGAATGAGATALLLLVWTVARLRRPAAVANIEDRGVASD